MRRCCDTTFLSDLIRGDEGAARMAEEWSAGGDELVMTAVNWYEVALGIARESNLKKRREFARRWERVSRAMGCHLLSKYSADVAAARQSNLMASGQLAPVTDLFIAAIAYSHRCDTIVTRNAADFDRIGLLPVQKH